MKFNAMWGLLVVSGVFIAGCAKQNVSGPDTSGLTTAVNAYIESAAANDIFVSTDVNTFVDQNVQPTNYDLGFGKIDSAITPLRWGRFITDVQRTVTTNVLPGDTTAVATIVRTITGVLKIRIDDTTTISKGFTDVATRNVLFVRRPPQHEHADSSDTLHYWVPVASSLINGATTPAPVGNEIQITQLDAFTSDGDTITITDPTQSYLRYWTTGRWRNMNHNRRDQDCPDFHGGTVTLRVTLVSASADTDLVALRYGFDILRIHGTRRLMPCVSEVKNADNTYTRVFERTWSVHAHGGYFAMGVDALTRATLFDSDAPYSVNWWGVPYHVH
jgi:hypothetical protein